MWFSIAKWILKKRVFCLIILGIFTIIMGYEASKVQLSYDYNNVIPASNPKFKDYENFKKLFGDDGNDMIIGVESDQLFTLPIFNKAITLQKELQHIPGVIGVFSFIDAVHLSVDTQQRFVATALLNHTFTSQDSLNHARAIFQNDIFYRNRIYNPETHAYIYLIQLNADSINSGARTLLIDRISKAGASFTKETGIAVHESGFPYIRTTMANRIAVEMRWFLTSSILLSALALLLFFRSFSTMVISLTVVIIGVIWCIGFLVICGYKITLLSALIPPLVIVIGIPNCIYFLNKYHTSYKHLNNQKEALIAMIGKMGIITLFCNIAAAIGFAVFAFTQSSLLKEFGVVAGLTIFSLFFISLLFLPSVLSFLPIPKTRHLNYLHNRYLEKTLERIEKWCFQHMRWILSIAIVCVVISLLGTFKLKSEGFIVDDFPKKDPVYVDLLWFQNNFKGILPLEVLIDTKRKNGITRSLALFQNINDFSDSINAMPMMSIPTSFVNGLKFARQAYYQGDTTSYSVPNTFDMIFLAPYLNQRSAQTHNGNSMSKMMNSFIDSNKQIIRITTNMKDVGSAVLPSILQHISKKANQIFDTSKYQITYTGSCITFLEGINFIIKGLVDSIVWAFVLIAICMLYLFKSFRILICSLIPNMIPLLMTAGIMGWMGIALKPSTVLIFSVALGIAIDITIRFLVNYKQEQESYQYNTKKVLSQTIRHTGVSILYTSFVLIAGFFIFCFSSFGGTRSLGWLTSLTLLFSTITNLILLPVLLLLIEKTKK